MAVEVSIDQAEALKVPAGWPAAVVVDAEPMRQWPARVSGVRPGPDRSATLRLELLEWPASARAGMSCTVHLRMASRAQAVAVPNHALLSLRGTPSVWIVTRGAIAVRAVTLGIRGDSFSEVLDGVASGQPVVTGPHAVLRVVRAGDAVAVATTPRPSSQPVAAGTKARIERNWVGVPLHSPETNGQVPFLREPGVLGVSATIA